MRRASLKNRIAGSRAKTKASARARSRFIGVSSLRAARDVLKRICAQNGSEEQVRAAIDASGMTRDEFARVLGVGRDELRDWEDGREECPAFWRVAAARVAERIARRRAVEEETRRRAAWATRTLTPNTRR